MGISDLAKRLYGDAEAMKESRRLLALARELLAAAPAWRRPGDQAALSARALELESALKSLDGRLILGLLGGTGVGKSTLISALAGEPISTASVIRPTSTRPLIYRHAAFPPVEGLEGQEVIHEIAALRSLAIVDFPDFDSVETAHHQVVFQKMRDLDLVLWVTDFHKYADRRLYEVMRRVNLGAASQRALLNKRDELLAGPGGEEALAEISRSFGEHLVDFGGWQGATPWPVSAAEALAAPGDAAAGGLGPLRRLLDDLADAKYRRAVETGNLEARNRDFLAALKAAAQPGQWLKRLEELGRLQKDYQPSIPLEADLALLRMHNFLYLNPRLETLKAKARGLLAFLTDLWDFAARRFKSPPETAQAPPRPLAPAFAHHLAGWSQEIFTLAVGQAPITEDEALKEGEEILQAALAEAFKEPRLSSALLWLWPLAWAFLLIWAESGGLYTPSALTAAALRSAAPWLIFSALGDLALSRFIWFRARRAYERAFDRALTAARARLMKAAEEQVLLPIQTEEQRLTRILDLSADLCALTDQSTEEKL